MTDTEKAALERRIDELCQENERLRNQLHDQQDTAEHNFVRNAREYRRVCVENDKLHDEVERLRADQAHWELGNCPSCPNVVSLQEALEQNAKLRELGGFMLRCMKRNSDCDYCLANGEHCEISNIEADALELGIEVTS